MKCSGSHTSFGWYLCVPVLSLGATQDVLHVDDLNPKDITRWRLQQMLLWNSSILRCRGSINETQMKERAHLMTPVKPLPFMWVADNILIAFSSFQNIKKVLFTLEIQTKSSIAKRITLFSNLLHTHTPTQAVAGRVSFLIAQCNVILFDTLCAGQWPPLCDWFSACSIPSWYSWHVCWQ